MSDRSARVDIHISACAVSHLGVLLRLLSTHCVYSTYHYTSYSRRSPLGIVISTIHTIRPSLNCCTPVINPRRKYTARVTVVVLCVYVCVCMCVCVCVHSYLPPHTLQSQNRDTNGFCAIQYRDRFNFFGPIFLKMLRSKVMA